MKVMIPQSFVLDHTKEESEFQTKSVALPFNKESNGKYVASLKLKFPNSGKDGDTRAPEVNANLTLEGQTTRTSKGVRRIMLKASMPYFSMTAKDELLTSPIEPAANRSGGELSLHTVLTLPASAEKDQAGANGSIGKRACTAQVRLIAAALNALAGSILRGALENNPVAAGTPGLVDLVVTSPKTESEVVEKGSALSMYRPVVFCDENGSTSGVWAAESTDCGVTLDISDKVADLCLIKPLARGLNGLAPLADDTTVVMETVISAPAEV